MSIVSVLILVVVTISIVWAFKTGYVKALSEGYGQRLVPLMEVVQQRKQKIVDPLYNVAAAQQTRNAYWQAAEQVQEELEKVYRRVDFLSSGAVEGVGGVLALRDVREHRAEFDNTLGNFCLSGYSSEWWFS